MTIPFLSRRYPPWVSIVSFIAGAAIAAAVMKPCAGDIEPKPHAPAQP
jgi:hypothetical protein